MTDIRWFALVILPLAAIAAGAAPAAAVVYCQSVGVPKGCVARPVAHAPHAAGGVGGAASGVGVMPGAGAGAAGPGLRAGTPANRGGPVNRVGPR